MTNGQKAFCFIVLIFIGMMTLGYLFRRSFDADKARTARINDPAPWAVNSKNIASKGIKVP